MIIIARRFPQRSMQFICNDFDSFLLLNFFFLRNAARASASTSVCCISSPSIGHIIIRFVAAHICIPAAEFWTFELSIDLNA